MYVYIHGRVSDGAEKPRKVQTNFPLWFVNYYSGLCPKFKRTVLGLHPAYAWDKLHQQNFKYIWVY